jgi:hypothetical protein
MLFLSFRPSIHPSIHLFMETDFSFFLSFFLDEQAAAAGRPCTRWGRSGAVSG